MRSLLQLHRDHHEYLTAMAYLGLLHPLSRGALAPLPPDSPAPRLMQLDEGPDPDSALRSRVQKMAERSAAVFDIDLFQRAAAKLCELGFSITPDLAGERGWPALAARLLIRDCGVLQPVNPGELRRDKFVDLDHQILSRRISGMSIAAAIRNIDPSESEASVKASHLRRMSELAQLLPPPEMTPGPQGETDRERQARESREHLERLVEALGTPGYIRTHLYLLGLEDRVEGAFRRLTPANLPSVTTTSYRASGALPS